MYTQHFNRMRSALGLTSRQMAHLLQVPQSQLSMAAGGFRPMPAHALPSMRLMENLAIDSEDLPQKLSAKKRSAPNGQRQIFVKKQVRLLILQREKLCLQLEKESDQLLALEKRSQWLTDWMASFICQADEGRCLAAHLLLRQTQEALEKLWQQVHQQQASLAALQAALTHWENIF